MPTHDPEHRYGVLVPVKPPAVAKSRLAAIGDAARADLARAFALDTVTAALDSPAVGCVLAVTDDHELAGALRDLGALVIPDGVADDLNGTLRQAAAELVRRFPGQGLAALCADLPALRAAELTRALGQASDRLSFLADSDGIGTTLVVAPDLGSFRPQFGPGSRAAHLAAAAEEIDAVDVPSVRRDVDTPADLDAALALGVGPSTSLVATVLGIGRR